MKVIILGYGPMLTNLIAGCADAGAEIVGVFRYDRVRYAPFDRIILDIFNSSKEYNYIKSHKYYEINARSANSAEFKKEILKLNADIVLVGTWGEKLKKSIIDLPKIATINAHPALLPKYRGPNPYLQAIKHMETKSGVTFHLMDEKYDTGPILLQKTVPIEMTDTGEELRQKTVIAAREGVRELLKELDSDIIIPLEQDESRSSYYSHIEEDEVMLDFLKPAAEIGAKIRAFHPWYKCYFKYNRHFFIPNAHKLAILENELPLTRPSGTLSRKGRGVNDGRSGIPARQLEGQIVDKSHKERSITVVCGDGKLLKMSGVSLYGLFNQLFTKLYIRHRVKIFENIV